jgi:hypothetical protein
VGESKKAVGRIPFGVVQPVDRQGVENLTLPWHHSPDDIKSRNPVGGNHEKLISQVHHVSYFSLIEL